MAIDHSGHRDRLRTRFLKDGDFNNFEPHNILELLLFYSVPRRDTNEMAHELINTFGSLSAVFDASYDDLIKIGKVSPSTACLIKSIIPMSRAYSDDKFNKRAFYFKTEDFAELLLKKYHGEMTEKLSVISLDSVGRFISFDYISKGSLDHVDADARTFVEILLRTKATSCVIAHNHPGNFALPSDHDAYATSMFSMACCSIGVRLIDHIIVAGDDCISMRESKEYSHLFNYSKEK